MYSIWATVQKYKISLFQCLLLILVLFLSTSIATISAPVQYDNGEYLQSQQDNLARTYSTGLNRHPCLKTLRGGDRGADGRLLQWTKIFDTAFWVPVVPEECVVCVEDYTTPTITECPGGDRQAVPLPANLIPHILIRLYGLLASISTYAMVLVLSVLGVRQMFNGLSKEGAYAENARNLRRVATGILIVLTVPTIFLQILFSVVQLPETTTDIFQACIPTNDDRLNNLQGNTINNTTDFCKIQPSPTPLP